MEMNFDDLMEVDTSQHTAGTGAAQPGTEGTRAAADLEKFSEEGVTEKMKKRSFIFTINNPKLDSEEIIQLMKNESAIGLVFQQEVGTNGTPHYQGFVRFKNARLYGPLCTLLDGWVRPCKNDIAARRYCSKKETRISGPWGFGCPEAQEEIMVISEEKFKDWQKELVEILRGPIHDREIVWRWSLEGNVGKSSLAKWLVVKMKAFVFSGKAGDIKSAIADMVEAGKRVPDILIWDIPRTQEQFVSYQALEEVKNGLFFSGKFHGSMPIFNPRHVVVFANFPPEETKMSKDRWSNIKNIDM